MKKFAIIIFVALCSLLNFTCRKEWVKAEDVVPKDDFYNQPKFKNGFEYIINPEYRNFDSLYKDDIIWADSVIIKLKSNSRTDKIKEGDKFAYRIPGEFRIDKFGFIVEQLFGLGNELVLKMKYPELDDLYKEYTYRYFQPITRTNDQWNRQSFDANLAIFSIDIIHDDGRKTKLSLEGKLQVEFYWGMQSGIVADKLYTRDLVISLINCKLKVQTPNVLLNSKKALINTANWDKNPLFKAKAATVLPPLVIPIPGTSFSLAASIILPSKTDVFKIYGEGEINFPQSYILYDGRNKLEESIFYKKGDPQNESMQISGEIAPIQEKSIVLKAYAVGELAFPVGLGLTLGPIIPVTGAGIVFEINPNLRAQLNGEVLFTPNNKIEIDADPCITFNLDFKTYFATINYTTSTIVKLPLFQTKTELISKKYEPLDPENCALLEELESASYAKVVCNENFRELVVFYSSDDVKDGSEKFLLNYIPIGEVILNQKVLATNLEFDKRYVFRINDLDPEKEYYIKLIGDSNKPSDFKQFSVEVPLKCDPILSTDILKDGRDGNRYKISQFGNNFWFCENLRHWPWNEDFQCYDDDLQTCVDFGLYYNYEQLNLKDESKQGVCPKFWHIPTILEWENLLKNASLEDIVGHGWIDLSEPQPPYIGFRKLNFLPAGYHYASKSFWQEAGFATYLWTSDVDPSGFPIVLNLFTRERNQINSNWSFLKVPKRTLASCRCIQD